MGVTSAERYRLLNRREPSSAMAAQAWLAGGEYDVKPAWAMRPSGGQGYDHAGDLRNTGKYARTFWLVDNSSSVW